MGTKRGAKRARGPGRGGRAGGGGEDERERDFLIYAGSFNARLKRRVGRQVARTPFPVVRLRAISHVINDPRIKENSSMTPDASVSFYIARRSCVSAHRRSISTARQIYRVMDGRGKLQIVLSLKDRLRLTFPAPTCTAGSAARGPDPIPEPRRYLRTVPPGADGHIFRGFPAVFPRIGR